jgi:CheY-like chemotaxis protein
MAKILVVEDNEMDRDMLARRLQLRGYEVIIAGDGRQGIVLAHSEAPDLILMDMSLPVLDGWEATQQLKAAPASASIPAIALAAHAMADDREKALEAGCDDYDAKPIEMPRLLAKVEALLAKKAASTLVIYVRVSNSSGDVTDRPESLYPGRQNRASLMTVFGQFNMRQTGSLWRDVRSAALRTHAGDAQSRRCDDRTAKYE